jgi:hypothetical protein
MDSQPITKFERAAQVARHTKESETRAVRTRLDARLWRAVRAATRLLDHTVSRGRGIYEVSPELMLNLKSRVDDLRHALARHDAELLQGGGDE